MNSKIYTAIAIVLLGTSFWANAQNTVTLENGVQVSNASVTKTSAGVNVVMDVDFSKAKVKTNRSLHVMPVLAGAQDTLVLAKLNSLGRNRYFYNLRNSVEMPQDADSHTWRNKACPDSYHVDITVPYESWMNGSRLMVNEKILGCCNKTLENNWAGTDAMFNLPAIPVYVPAFVFRKPKAEVSKTRSLKATSYVDFPVSRIEIFPEYRNNPRELARILNTIDSVRTDKDITIQSILLKGFASPESPYDNNYRLASGRTNSIRRYIAATGLVPMNVIDTDFEPENWEGLRAYVVASNISNKEGIIKIIDSVEIEPDRREALLRKTYPQEYAFLKEECYPALRKVDYEIHYEIRNFITVEEIMEAYKSDPSKLSKDEFYVLASSLKEDDPLHDILLKDAVKFYPEDPATNLNAANVAMKEGRLRDAGAQLEKAGETLEAIYARGVYAALIGDLERAEDCFQKVKTEIPEANQALEQVQTIAQLKSLWNK